MRGCKRGAWDVEQDARMSITAKQMVMTRLARRVRGCRIYCSQLALCEPLRQGWLRLFPDVLLLNVFVPRGARGERVVARRCQDQLRIYVQVPRFNANLQSRSSELPPVTTDTVASPLSSRREWAKVVDPDGAVTHLASHAVGLFNVARLHTAGESVLCVIGEEDLWRKGGACYVR